jgi:hypothetical protein
VRFAITWNGAWGGYRVSVPNLGPVDEPVDVVTADEADKWLRALEILADESNWSRNPMSHDAVLYGHFTPYELAVDALKPATASAPERAKEPPRA